MSFAFMPLYTGDYLRDTRHLSPLRHGVYLMLLMHCWDSKGPAPLDEQECAGIANCRSGDEIEALRYVLGKFFVKMNDGWYSTRMQAEIEKSEQLSRTRSDAGRKGYEARAKHLPSKSQASASTPTPTPIPPPALPPPPVQKPARAADADAPARKAVWEAYSGAMHARYSVPPVRNAKVNAQIKAFCERVPVDVAPLVAAAFVQSNRATYVSARHSTDLLLRDAEGLHIDWQRGAGVTDTEARMADKTQTNFNAFAPLLAAARAKEDAE